MDMKQQAEDLFNLPISRSEKISLLEELILDCSNELEAQSENMNPEVTHNLAEALRIATDYLRVLQAIER